MSIPRLDGTQWTHFWSLTQLLCFSPPIIVQNGGTQAFDIRVSASKAGNNVFPQVEGLLVTRVYRLVWNEAYFNYLDRPWSDPVPESLRVSNRFVIRAP